MKTVFYLMGLLLMVSSTYGNIRIYTLENPPIVEKMPTLPLGVGGLLGKVVSERVERSGKISNFEVAWVPWKRALLEVKKGRTPCFFP